MGRLDNAGMPQMLPHSVRSVPLLDPALCWPLLSARDDRADGRFFVGVASTGIYCRPICPARTPRREHCRFYSTAAGAEAAGYRPCLRCRPELAPGHASVDAPARLAQGAAALIEDGAMEQGGLAHIAQRLGVTDRHLRRVFMAQFGVTSIAYAQTQRLLLAKRLLTDTRLPVTEVALAAGFASVRRFNDSFSTRYRIAPSALRRVAAGASSQFQGHDQQGLVFRLAYRPPLDWAALTSFLAHRCIEGVEAMGKAKARRVPRVSGEGTVYRRIVRVPTPQGATVCGWIELSGLADRAAAGHLLQVRVAPALSAAIPAVLARVRRVCDLGARPDEVEQVLGPLAVGREGVRLPGAFDGFEIAVRAILGQQVTVQQARIMAGRLVQQWGEPVATPWPELTHAFPQAARLAACSTEDLRSIGLLRARSNALIELSRAVSQGELRLDPDVDVPATLTRLMAIAGIGDWTAQYVAMRALGWPDAFPAADVGVMKALGVKTAAQARRAAEIWRPWRGYAVIHLWNGATP